jgi:hypothetical protein
MGFTKHPLSIVSKPTREVTNSQTLNLLDELVVADTSGGDIVLTLPPLESSQGARYSLKKTGAPNTLTISGQGSDTIDGQSSLVLRLENSSLSLRATTGGWVII